MFSIKKIQKIMIVFMAIVLLSFVFPAFHTNADGPLDGFNFQYQVDANGQASFGANATGEIENMIDDNTFANKTFSTLQKVIFGIFGVCSLTMVVLFIINFVKLGTAAGNPQERAQATKNLLYLGIATALLGAVTLFIGFSTNLLK